MELLLSFFAPYLPVFLVFILTLFLAVIAILSFFFDVTELAGTAQTWRKEKMEFQKSVNYLKQINYFFAHIVHLGGNFSKIHSLTVLSDKEGGYNFNPPEKFVAIGFNEKGDLITVRPTTMAIALGFKVDSVSSSTNSICHPQDDGSFCVFSTDKLKNEFSVRFARRK